MPEDNSSLQTTNLTMRTVDPPARKEPSASGMTRLAVLGAILLPLAVIPYLATRKEITSLRTQVKKATTATQKVQRELSTVMLATEARKEEDLRIRALLDETKQEMIRLRLEMQKKDRLQMAGDVRLQKLSEENTRIRKQMAVFPEMGTSIAHVAAFMHEVELHQGLPLKGDKDVRGIHQLRLLALQLQDMPKQLEHEEKEEST